MNKTIKILSTIIVFLLILQFGCRKEESDPTTPHIQAAVLVSPTNHAIDQPTSLTLTWNASSGATSYALQVSAYSDFSSFTYNEGGLTSTSQQIIGLSNKQTYYWRVKASINDGSSSWSTVWSFTTVAATYLEGYTYYSGTTIPVSGVMVEIQSKSFTTSSTGYFRFDNLYPGTNTLTANKSGYDDYVNSIALVEGTNSHIIPMTSSLYTHNLSGTIVLSNTLQPLPLVTVTVLNADSTLSQLATTSDYSGHYQVPIVPQGQRRVQYYKQNYQKIIAQIFMNNSDYTYNVQLTNKPGIPGNPFPTNGSTNQDMPISLRWACTDPDGEPIKYDVYFSTENPPVTKLSSDYEDIIFNIGVLTDTTNYYWRIVAKSNNSDSTSSPIWTFKTGYLCGSLINYFDKKYNPIRIGTQCWLKENLDVGIRIDGSQNQTDNSTIEKYCYNNDPNNCTTYGGLYQWNEAMQYSTIEGARGICPSGWHIPTYNEFLTLYYTVGSDGNTFNSLTDTSGFSALPSGERNYFLGSFYGLGNYTFIWSSKDYYSGYDGVQIPYNLELNYSSSWVGPSNANGGSGFSVRCIKD